MNNRKPIEHSIPHAVEVCINFCYSLEASYGSVRFPGQPEADYKKPSRSEISFLPTYNFNDNHHSGL